MTKLVVCLLFFGLFAIQTVGHMNSDPAPGRSPGPPTEHTNRVTVSAATLNTASSAAGVYTENSNNKENNRSNNNSSIGNNNSNNNTKNNENNSNNNNNNNENKSNKTNTKNILFNKQKTTEENILNDDKLKNNANHNVKDVYVDNVDENVDNDDVQNETLVKQMLPIHQAPIATTERASETKATNTLFSLPFFAARNQPLIAEANVIPLPAADVAAVALTTNDKVHAARLTATTSTTTTTTRKAAATPTTTTTGAESETNYCDESLSKFLNDVDIIDETETTETTNASQQEQQATQSQHIRIQLHLEHDTFDTHTFGINCGLMYKVRLTTNMPSSSTTIISPLSSKSPPRIHYSGEFFIETISLLNGRERGSFVGHTLGNKLPISWFNTLHHNQKSSNSINGNDVGAGVGVSAGANADANADADAARIPLKWMTSNDEAESTDNESSNAEKNEFNSATSTSDEDKFAFNSDYWDVTRRNREATSTSNKNAQKVNANNSGRGSSSTGSTSGGSRSAKMKACPDNKWRDSTKSHMNAIGNVTTDSVNFWFVNELCEQDDTIEFRVFFRATKRGSATDNASSNRNDNNGGSSINNDANVEAQYEVYKKTFKFQLRKDCQLQLRELSTTGTLDYTTLPLYSIDCTVNFPNFQHTETNIQNNAISVPPPGILVVLQRLNIPCSSGGYVRFNERANLCGKLEELPDSDRAYHFDVRQTTSVRFHKNPMFSLSYKLVDYCYNVTTSNQTGEFYIRPSLRNSLECYFRIHLPYGNRILLRLVTNNDSDILQSSMNGVNQNGDAFANGGVLYDDTMQAIYTSLGVNIETQVINLTLSDSNYFTTLRGNDAAINSRNSNSTRTSGNTHSYTEPNSAYGFGLDSFAFLTNNNANMRSTFGTAGCNGVVIKVFENDHSKWSHCINSTEQMRGFVLESSSNMLSIHLYRPARNRYYGNGLIFTTDDAYASAAMPAIYLSYQARSMPEIVSNCAFGWVAMQQFCVSAVEVSLSWHNAEQHCISLGGHLTSIRNEAQQQIVNELLLNSPGYQDQNAYWVGASDKSYEGDFRWSDGLSFQYTNWFPGWLQHGHYNRQPNDDGLSSQDCIELRRYFRTPPGIQTNRSPLTSTFMWNDRDCSAENFLICERAMSDESIRRSWINDCNKTVSLTKEHPRASIWSPSFPRQYPDNANCYTTITAPTGYRIVIEFEELVIENEPGCTYDYLEITEPTHLESVKTTKSSKHKNFNNNINNNINTNKTFRKRSSYENPSLRSYTSTSTFNTNSNANFSTNNYNNNNYYDNINNNNFYDNFNNNNNNNNFNYVYNNNDENYANSNSFNINDNYLYSNNYNNYNLAQTNYQKLLHIFSSLYKPHTNFLIQTPDYPRGNPYYHHSNHHIRSSGNDAEMLPKRLCGDWSSKLKLLRHVTAGSYLGLHFVSDYSHHFGGYKAKTYMENRSPPLRAASECGNERLKPYNGSCYLFVSYPEVDWFTAQQVCHGLGAKLSSVSTSDEHRFITSNIRNHIDYSPQLIYWLGAELEKNGQFEWTDDTKMSFQGWLPGQGQFDVMPADAMCLGLQWKMSPTPMLPSGLYWQSQKCTKVGGYVCKKPKESFGNFAVNNFTVNGTEGRLVSPAYPNTYPLNLDYWIHIKSSERTRIIVQFQKIDLEPQDECLYDFVSIENYELVSKITLEPGTNPLPMAMLMSADVMTQYDDENDNGDNDMQSNLHRRLGRHINKKKHISVSTAIQHRRKRNIRNEYNYNIMTQSAMQMPNQNVNGQHNIAKKHSCKHCKNIVNRKKHNNNNKSHKRQERTNDTNSQTNENPKRRRRKKYSPEIENKLPKNLSNDKNVINKANTAQEMHLSQHQQKQLQQQQQQQRPQKRKFQKLYAKHRQRRSIIVNDGILNVPTADNAQSFLPYVRWCGSHDSNMSKFDFVSSSNQVMLNFHSDYSVTGLGFAATWKAIDVSGCPLRTLTAHEGTIDSPNYPHFLLNNLNCAYVIQAPLGKRVWLEFKDYDLLSDSLLEVDIGSGAFRPFRQREHLNEGVFVSLREQLRVQFRTGQHPRGKGFQAIYRIVGQSEPRERVINLTSNVTGYLYQLNYPQDVENVVDFTQHLVAPFGDNILLELHGVEFSENGCPDNNILEIYDNYADNNGTKWQLCKFANPLPYTSNPIDDNYYGSTEQNSYVYHQQTYNNRLEVNRRSQQYAAPPVYITSYLNTLHIRQHTTAKSDANLNATVRIQWDNNYKMKLTSGDKAVESCQPNPCQYNGKCVINNGTSYCQCQGHYTGRFCGLNLCELEPCVFGKCELTVTNFKCQCQPGYMGTTCEQKQRPCADNPCEGRGICFEKNGGYFCRCHAWWEGHKCERRMMHIPYKPLSERMLQEPFWLGLITVFVVLAVIGLVWCAKRHFPEKIEKLLAEEADRNRPPGSIHGHHHHTSLREQLQFTTAIPQTTVSNAPGAPRSIFNRLGIRKPSLLSLSSPNPIPGGGGAAARTFSLDDLLRPPPRRSPSPRKKRNNSTPVKKNATEKKQILQQLVSPAVAQAKPKVSLDELISMSENRLRVNNIDSESDLKETTFSENSGSLASGSIPRTITDPKLEKKVTFARLLNKVSAEMSSGSEVDIGQMGSTRNSSALSLPTDIQFRASSMPPSPCTNDIRSPHSTSSNQGSDSLSSSDLALTDFGLRSIQNSGSEIGGTSNQLNSLAAGIPARCRIGSPARPKVSSADSILAMFRNFGSISTTASITANNIMPSTTSIFISPSTTPTVSSPQDDAPGDDESSTSSMHTPVSFSSGPPDSPVFYRQTTIEVPVLDVLNAHKTSSPSSSTSSSSTNLLHPPTILLEIPSNGINNKCLSPIREMPTPIPSPALTPIMPRPQRSNSPIFQEDPLSSGDFSDDEIKSERSERSDAQLSERLLLGLQRNRSDNIDTDVETTPTDTTTTCMADINKPHPFNKLPLLHVSPAPTLPMNALTPPMITIDVEPPTPEDKAVRPRDLIIPTLTVEQPSPTKNRYPMIIFPGSPPPQRASIGETSFMFPNKQQQKRLLKQFEKPTSLDFPFVPPMITITSNMSEMESDTEPMSPAVKATGGGGLMPPNPVGMCYLSPFTMCGRADRTISESNLSSSGYSSMASPGPSRCGSSNPLCPNEMDEPGSGHSGAGLSLHVNLMNRRRSSALSSCKENITNGKSTGTGSSGASGSSTDRVHGNRQRSDSETFSDDILLESNDEGIGTDHVDEKLEDNRLNSTRLKELDVFMEEQILIEVDEPQTLTNSVNMLSNANQMSQLQLPSIVIQIDGNEKGLSPVSSRSESPLSDRAGLGRFSPHFYGRKDQLPFTDSDGLYDFPSSDGKGTSAQSYTHQRRSSSKKRERKSSKCSTSQSPTKQQLEVPSKESLNTNTTTGIQHVCNKHCHSHNHPCPATTVTTRKSPKRRILNRLPIASSSSSSESLTSTKELSIRPLPRRLNSPNKERKPRKQESLSEDEVADALLRRISPSIVKEVDVAKPKCKINRLRAIGNQIRFLRRLEKSIKTRERLASASDSCPEENTDDMDSPQATSPLLQPTSPNKTRVALCRQKRLPGGTYGITASALSTSNWKGMDRSLIGDDLNSD